MLFESKTESAWENQPKDSFQLKGNRECTRHVNRTVSDPNTKTSCDGAARFLLSKVVDVTQLTYCSVYSDFVLKYTSCASQHLVA